MTELTSRIHEIGRSFSIMMSQNWFSKSANKITTPHLFLKLMDNFLTRCMMLPPPDPLSSYPYEMKASGRGCWGDRSEKRDNMTIPSATFQRSQHQLRHRQRVLHQHNNDLINTALQQEPTEDELENNDTKPFINRLTRKDWIISGIIALVCIGVMVLVNCFSFATYV